MNVDDLQDFSTTHEKQDLKKLGAQLQAEIKW